MSVSAVEWINGEKYGRLIGQKMREGNSLENAIRNAYMEYGAIPVSKLFFGKRSPMMGGLCGVVETICRQKKGFHRDKLTRALLKESWKVKSESTRQLLTMDLAKLK